MDDLPKRKPIRLPDYDYAQNGCYFVTVCTKNKKPLLWKPVGADIIRPPGNNKTHLSDYGNIVNTAILTIPMHYPNAKIDEYVIMPDHVHLILRISNDDKNGRMISAPTKSIATMIGQMKRWVSKQIGFPIWQKSYYEHIIRNETDYIQTVEYIMNNPLKRELYRRQTEK